MIADISDPPATTLVGQLRFLNDLNDIAVSGARVQHRLAQPVGSGRARLAADHRRQVAVRARQADAAGFTGPTAAVGRAAQGGLTKVAAAIVAHGRSTVVSGVEVALSPLANTVILHSLAAIRWASLSILPMLAKAITTGRVFHDDDRATGLALG